VVIDNMRAGALERMGFSYAELRTINPRIVAVSMSGFGETGPERDRMAYGSIIDAMSGVASINGEVGGGPTDFPMSLPDPCAGIHAAIATVAAVMRARATGEGERVECSMLEASVAALPWPVLIGATTGHEPDVIGNRDELAAPHDVFRCEGTYQWVAISARTAAQFAALAAVIGRPDLAADPTLASVAGRQARADELDAAVTAWTHGRDARDAADTLQAAGVPAERVAHIDDLFTSPTLTARRFLLTPDHPEVGRRAMAGVAWRASRTPMCVTVPAPCLGADTRAVLHEVLGLSDDAIDALVDDDLLR
jgi:crotonobetainyl-CoA:carnitine CoA-transferase CaiB-like acyl-CoA transferase